MKYRKTACNIEKKGILSCQYIPVNGLNKGFFEHSSVCSFRIFPFILFVYCHWRRLISMKNLVAVKAFVQKVWNGNKNSSGRKVAARISQLWQIWIKSPNILLLRSQAVICRWNNQVFSELRVTKGKQCMVEMESSQFAHYQKASRRETPRWMLYWNHSETFRENVFSEHLKIACFNDIFCSIESALFTFE